MLDELSVRNLGIISQARIEPGSGLVVVSGETGAGKTMLLGALELLVPLGAAEVADVVAQRAVDHRELTVGSARGWEGGAAVRVTHRATHGGRGWA